MLNDVWFARQPSTVSAYCYSLRKFFLFCRDLGFKLKLPVSAALAANYLSYLRNNLATKSAVSSAMNALKWLHNFVPGINVFNDPLNDKIVKMVYDSALRHCLKTKNQKRPLPATFIRKISSSVSEVSSLVYVRDVTIICLAYNLLFRHDEVAHISCAHISEVNGGYKFLIPFSKTDQYKDGNCTLLSEGRTLNLLKLYMTKAGLVLGEPKFLFGPMLRRKRESSIKNAQLSYTSYSALLRRFLVAECLEPKIYGFHSCRSGGASSPATKVTQFELMHCGRWKSSRFIAHYVGIPDNRKLQFSRFLSH